MKILEEVETNRRRPRAAFYIGSVALLVAILASAWMGVDTISRRSYLQYNARGRELEAAIASNAIAESLNVTMSQSNIIATYSFSEYFQGKRSEESMQILLESERRQLPSILINAYIEATGRFRFASAGEDSDAAKAALEADWRAALEALTSGAAVVMDAKGDRWPFFYYYLPVRRGGRLVGLFGSAIGLEPAIRKYLLPLEGRSGRRAYLLGDDWTVLWSSKSEETGKPFEERAWDEESSSEESIRLGGYTFRIYVDDDSSSLRAALMPAERLRVIVFLAGIVLIIAAMGAAAKLYVSEGKRIDHIKAEKRLADAVREKERELAESELRYSALFEAASDAIVIFDSDESILNCNSRALALFNRPLGEVLGKRPEDFSPSAQPDGTKSAEAALAIFARARGSYPAPVIFEWTHSRRDGSELVVEASISIVKSGGATYLQAILRDATERRRQLQALQESLDEREVLLRELHHRVKNNLQFLVSLIELQRGFEGAEAREALMKTQSRVSTLAAVYLAAADRPETLLIDAPVYLRSICDLEASAEAAEGVSLDIALDCEAQPLSLDAAVSIGLILRELLENSARHGYGRGGGGKVEVGFLREGADSLALTIRDYGRGLARGWESRLGISLARALAEQLSGSLDIAAAEPGVRSSLRFPLS